MRSGYLSLLLTAVLALGATAFAGETMSKNDLAKRIVNQSAGVKEGDHVLIVGGVRDLELLEDVAVNVRHLGAFPLITITSDRLNRRLITEVPASFDAQLPEFDALLANYADVVINVDAGEEAGYLSGIAPERLEARARASASIGDVLRRRGVRQVSLGNDLYPTAGRARQFGISRDQLSDIFWKGVNVDYANLTATGDRLRSTLNNGNHVRITTPSGTDVKMSIEGRPVMVSDGTLTADSVTRGTRTQAWLPAGEVFLTPVANTADGRIVVERFYYQGKPIDGLILEIKEGKVTSMNARSGIEPLRAAYALAGPGKDALSVLDFGINPNVTIPNASNMVAWMPAGMVTVSFGNNTWAGGENDVPFGLSLFLPNSSVALDGKQLIERGVAKF